MNRLFLIIAVLLLAPALSLADEAGTRDRLLALKSDLSDINSISGRFTQEKKLEFLNEPIISQGNFYFSRPDFLEWEYVEPAPSGLIIEGAWVEAWTGPPNKRAKQPAAMAEAARIAAGQVLIWMNLDPEAIAAAYQVSIIKEKPLVLKVSPRRSGARKMIESLRVEFSPDGRTVQRVILQEPESVTTLTFSQVRLNRPRPAE